MHILTSWEVRAANGRSSLSLAVRKCSILLPLPCNPITPAVRPKPHNNVILLRTLHATACPRPGLPHALAHFLLLFFDTSSCPCYDTIFLLADPFPPPPRAHLFLPLYRSSGQAEGWPDALNEEMGKRRSHAHVG